MKRQAPAAATDDGARFAGPSSPGRVEQPLHALLHMMATGSFDGMGARGARHVLVDDAADAVGHPDESDIDVLTKQIAELLSEG